MKHFLIVYLAFSCISAHAQLSVDQKVVDFQQFAALISKRYAFVEWKRDALHYDALSIADWVNRVKASKDDLEFFEICSQYIAALNDGHATFLLPSDYEATLGFNADFYSGKLAD